MQMCSYKAEHCSLNQFTIKNQAHSDNLNSHNSNDNKNKLSSCHNLTINAKYRKTSYKYHRHGKE